MQFSQFRKPKDVLAKDAGFETPAKVEASRLLLRLVRVAVAGEIETVDSYQMTLPN